MGTRVPVGASFDKNGFLKGIMQKDGMNRQIAKLWKRCLLLFMAMCAILVEYLRLSKVLLRKQIKIVQFDNL